MAVDERYGYFFRSLRDVAMATNLLLAVDAQFFCHAVSPKRYDIGIYSYNVRRIGSAM